MQMYDKRPGRGPRTRSRLRESAGWVLGSALVIYLWLAAALGLIAG